ncbi:MULTISPECIES: hypothetical protein [Nocardiaceae]|uniref:hypothetical protein n=1 Tax=Nocardiaceae TaxID=85025 RepID=UPI0003638EB8|nr:MULTISPECIES: hypothetical protein [Rhodococcus]OZC50812.1 hypothetical protein CH267_22430 [Rhodococcus sp. 06-621-2]OZF52524.1 hypothetical protein CH292_10325 [Rhodococcus sp. 14-2470-1a]
MKRLFVTTMAVFAATALAACGSSDYREPDTVAAVTATATPNSTETPLPDNEPAPEDQSTPGPNPVTIPPTPSRDDVNVDARDFERGDGQYFFRSPSENVFCGFNSQNAPGTVVGCQVRYSVPGSSGRECLNTENNTYGVQILEGGAVEQICTNQGIFVADDTPVLEYGQVIGVTGTVCRSTEVGVACYSGADSGFMISRDVNVTF